MNPHIENVVMQFDLPDGAWTAEPYGNGHINETYLVTTGEKRFILQRVNGYVFPKPEDVMDNIERVTAFLKAQIEREGGDPARETLTLVKTHQGKCFTYDREGGLWRMYLFVEDTVSYDLPDTPALFELSGEAFGKFQRQMGGFPADSLHETIHDFHNTPARYRQLEDAIARNEAGRLGGVTAEIEFCRQYEREVHALLDAMEAGEIPLRVTHNDTKLNNVLLDAQTRKALCVIDLDTVMPGFAANDFGDSIRFGASTAAEDETDLSKVTMSLDLYAAFAGAFLGACSLTQPEIELLPMGAKLMTLECGVRFLTDYLQGDTYFRVHRPGHNLDRTRTQFKLVADMEAKWAEMARITKNGGK